MQTIKCSVKNRIREFREIRGWSQAQLAEMINTSQTQIDRLEKNQRRLSDFWMQKFADAFKCPPEDLISSGTTANDMNAGIMKALECLIKAIISREVLPARDLETLFNDQLREFRTRNQSGAAQVMDQFLDFLHSARGELAPANQAQSPPPPQAKPKSKKTPS